ncbi:hypothetical protein EU523_00180 [Candidatus Heimdallarchaeota archaeon]|nr:MAG: hypothetical protein EU523_00180 [Candidatus Heimdallarchaeota archaeon]
MSKKYIDELEEILIKHALNRYDFDNAIGGKLFKTFLKGTFDSFQDYLIWLVKAVVRCVIEAEENIYLEDITSAAMAEAYVLMGFTPMRNLFTHNLDALAGNKIILQSEIHHWLLYLEKLDKLPGTYNRFTGLYKVLS